MPCADGGICAGGGSGQGWEVWRGRFVAVTEDILGVGRWEVAVEDSRNERRASVAVQGDGGFLDGHQSLHDEESGHVPRALVVKDGLTANVPTATPVRAVTFAPDPEQSTVFAISVHEPLATPLLHRAPRARVIHGSQILPDVATSPPSSPLMMSKTLGTVLSGKQSILSQGGLGRKSLPPMKEQEQGLVAALAGQTLLKRLGGVFWGAFWDAFSESESSRKIDVDKVRKVLEGKAVVQIVDVDVEPQKGIGCTVLREACSITAILEENMRSLTLGKK
ncbi:hypothetical protein ARMGADRAFT_1085206 [Armillaria gallica]|uniref:Uncharacterized protein n=1 Tax=Armillaria gallica TaxID=47427 RepID=A0A2H3DHZ1_ARMGA|nr:hypothetical protein ARMGADRAFT_1085206 [Armillaria gallica]